MSGGSIRHEDIRHQRRSISVRPYSSLSSLSLFFVLTMGYASECFAGKHPPSTPSFSPFLSSAPSSFAALQPVSPSLALSDTSVLSPTVSTAARYLLPHCGYSAR